MFRQIESANDSEIYILDKERGVIASSSDSGLSAQVTERLAGPSGLFKTALNGTDSMVTFTESKEAGWQYVSVMPMGSVERVAQLRNGADGVCRIACRRSGYCLLVCIPTIQPRQTGSGCHSSRKADSG